jgi:cysteine sulfinate desulfinase/cysteine desulfurase-like protein
MSDEKKLDVTIVPSDKYGRIDPAQIINALRPETKLVVMNHASNVRHCNRYSACTRIKELPLTFLVATGHKALNGPSGTGFIFARSTDSVSSLLVGGTGGNSASTKNTLVLRMSSITF